MTQAPLSLDEMIAPEQWSSWGRLLREHPSYLRGVIDLLPPSENHLDALRRTHMIGWWANQQGDQLTRAAHVERAQEQDYLIGVYFEDNPYSTPKGVAGIGTHYIDPLLIAQPITWEMVDRELLRDAGGQVVDFSRIIHASPHHGCDAQWLARMALAERQWFSNAPDAPVIVVEWKDEGGQAPGSGPAVMERWDATEQLLALDGLQRRQVDGFRQAGTAYPKTLGEPPPAMRARLGHPYTLKLRIHAASVRLMAHRQACKLDEATPDNGPASRTAVRL